MLFRNIDILQVFHNKFIDMRPWCSP